MLGSENFWDVPKFASDSLDITWGDLPAHMNYNVAPKAYDENNGQDWIKELNRPNPEDKTIPNYDGQALNAIKQFSDGWDDLKALFYNIQQISYYCDFTLESAQLSFSKVTDWDNSKAVLAERRNTKAQWKYILD
jgi:hypothetical protein